MSWLLGLAVVALPFVVSPGASFTLTLANAASSQRLTWLRIAGGTGAGIAVLALLMGATGIGTVLTSNPLAQLLLGLVGGAVLSFFGIRMLIRALRRSHPADKQPTTPPRLLTWSFLTLITNPKALGLYVLVVPSLAEGNSGDTALFAVFAAVHIILLTGWLVLVHQAATRIPGIARSPRVQRIIFALAGVVMIALGVTLGVETMMSFG